MTDDPQESALLLEVLRELPAFESLPETELRRVVDSATVVGFEAGTVIMQQGEQADCAYVLLEGKVSVFRGEQEVVQRGPGEWLGEVALIDRPLRSASARALTAVKALHLKAESFDSLSGSNHFARSLMRELSRKVAEGDVQLDHAMEKLRRLQSLKDDLFSLIIHDLRNPLTSVKGSVLLMRQEIGEHRLMENLVRSVKHMETLLEDVLDVQLLEEGQLPLRPVSLSLTEIARDVASELGDTALVRGVRIVVDVAGELMAEVDNKLVRRALENLVSNAIKYSPRESSILIALRTEGGDALVDVVDRGPGVPTELRNSLFRKFGSVELQRGSPRRGYGLGLHLVTLTAEAHRGGVSIHDNPAGGSIFRLRLPLRRAADA